MTAMLCLGADQLRALYLGQLSEEQSDELLSHVGACPACQAELETVFNLDDSLVVNLRQCDSESELDEPACEQGVLRALGALAIANDPRTTQIQDEPIGTSLPKNIGEYEILKALGHGGMGRVYLAKHSKLGRMVALKILAGHRIGDRLASQRFESEMRVIGRLAHPNIVNALDAREIDGTALLVTEFIDGLDLGQMVHRVGRLEIADACEIVRQIADALQYTSDQGFVHRDVKPSNIMISQAGEVKLLDLGLARLQFGDSESTEITGTGQTMGTADYISPEQVTDSRKVDVRSDIYSLGATLYRLLSGCAPFVGDKYMTAFAKMTAHVSASPANLRTLRADIPIELERLVTRMLSKRPEDRPQSPNEVAIKLSEFTRGCELKGLVQQAMSITPSSTPKAEAASTSKKTTSPQTQSFLHRPVAVYKAIAAGFFGMIVGLCFGILITITNPDGSKTTLSIPAGSKLEIAESGNKSNPLNSVGQVPETSMTAPPLQFALMVNKEDSGKSPFISDNDLTKLLEQLPRTNSNAVVQNDLVRFVRIAEMPGVEIPISAWNNGILYALVSTDPRYSIGWDEIEGRILESYAPKDANKQAVLTLKFDKTLGEKMSRLSSAGIGQQLAIMVDNVVVQSPKINSTIGTDVSITGVFSPSQVQNMRQYFSRSQSTSSNPIKSSVDEKALLQYSDARSSEGAMALELVAINLKLIEIDRMKLRTLGIDIDTKDSKLIEKSSSVDNPKFEELKDASFYRLVDTLVNAGAAKVISHFFPATMDGRSNAILIDTGKSSFAIELLPKLQGNSALVQFNVKQFELSNSSERTTLLSKTTKSRFFDAIVKLNTTYGINTSLATSMDPAEQLDTNLIMVVSFERQAISQKQAIPPAASTAARPVNIDLARMMRAIRSLVMKVGVDTENNAKELAIACGVPEKQPLIMDAIQSLSLDGIVTFEQGLRAKDAWLSDNPQLAYSIRVSPKELLEDVKRVVTTLAGPSVFEDTLNSLKNDPLGPQVDVRQIIQDRLSDIVVDTESSILAFKLSDTASLPSNIKSGLNLDGVGAALIGDYVVFGSRQQLQELSKRHAPSQ